MDIKFGNQVPKKSANKAVGTFSTTNASHVFVAMLSRIWIFGSGNSANQTVGKNKPITHQGPKTVGRISVFLRTVPQLIFESHTKLAHHAMGRARGVEPQTLGLWGHHVDHSATVAPRVIIINTIIHPTSTMLVATIAQAPVECF